PLRALAAGRNQGRLPGSGPRRLAREVRAPSGRRRRRRGQPVARSEARGRSGATDRRQRRHSAVAASLGGTPSAAMQPLPAAVTAWSLGIYFFFSSTIL